MRIYLLLLFLLSTISALCQNGTVSGVVTDDLGLPLPGVYIIPTIGNGVSTNGEGVYNINLPAGRSVAITFSLLGKKTITKNLYVVADEKKILNIQLQIDAKYTGEAVVRGEGRDGFAQKLEPRVASGIPSVRGTVEDLLLQAPVNFTSELSSSYNVRGGSFDENLVYVNGIQVYRPFLVRAGQQEGLSFPNTDMIDQITFSAGGFEAKYGDKMSSVLDIMYRKPKEFGGAFTASLLGGSLQLQGISENKKWSHNTGLRYRNNSYVLGTLDNQGDYNPRYTDLQTYLTFDPDTIGPWEINFLGTISQNVYNYVPQSRETDIGNINEALRLRVFYEGQEITQFLTLFGALSTSYTTDVGRYTLAASAFNTEESEHFDIFGQYFLDELDRDLGSDNFGDILTNRGVGGFLEHARNDLNASVINLAHTGTQQLKNNSHFLEWGARIQREIIEDKLSEWTYLDSAGYNQPRPNDSIGYQFPELQPNREIILTDVIKARKNMKQLK